jgi:hypothetical protein
MPTPANEQAALNDAEASAFREQPPSATQSCPLEKGIIAGIFFDGTGNNKYTDTAGGSESNVARLWEVYKTHEDDRYVRVKLYIIGPGASNDDEEVEEGEETRPDGGWWDNIGGMAKGKGAQERLNIAYRWLKAKLSPHKPTEKKLVDSFGFSRGASLARTFCNLTNQAMKKEVENVSHRFLGVFDTVGSWGKTEQRAINDGLDSGDSYNWAHFTARHEHRFKFPLTPLSGADKEYAGVHSDVGGGYADETPRVRNHISFVTCNHMYKRCLESDVDIDEPRKNGVDIELLYRQSEEYCAPSIYDPNGPWALARNAWFETYVHDSTGWQPWNWSTKDKVRGIERVKKLHIGALPPNFTWK